MRLISGYEDEGNRAYGLVYSRSPGYKRVIGVYVGRRQWAWEFGPGDGFDW